MRQQWSKAGGWDFEIIFGSNKDDVRGNTNLRWVGLVTWTDIA